jgi:hypothetical protein
MSAFERSREQSEEWAKDLMSHLGIDDPPRLPGACVARGQGGDFVRSLLSDDHAHLQQLLAAIVVRARNADHAELRADWQRFERDVNSHLEVEEQEILPVFALRHSEEAQALLEEHGRIRADLVELGVELDLHCLRAEKVASFVDLLRDHAAREDSLLYAWASQPGW